MPWQDVRPMDHRILFIADFVRGTDNFSALCAYHGISRKTGYKWVQRYRDASVEGLCEHSRRPWHSPQQVPYAVRQAVLELRHCGDLVLGPKKIRPLLARRFPHEEPPSETTIYRILKAAGEVTPRRRRRRVPPGPLPFSPVQGPNDVWSADFKGQFVMGNGHWCYPLTVMDHDSRFLVGCRALAGTGGVAARSAFEGWFREYGLPRRIRSDNGVPFATRTAGGLSPLAIWWIRLGILPERIAPGKPQQNGRHERMHETLKAGATQPPGRNLSAQQRRFNHFLRLYNEERPHEALEQHPPISRYRPSERPYPATLPQLEYPDYYQRRTVSSSGVMYWRNHQVYITHLLKGEAVGLNPRDTDSWDVYFGPVLLGRLDMQRVNTKSRRSDYLTLKVLPMS